MKLTELLCGQRAKIVGLGADWSPADRRVFLEMGIMEGQWVEVAHLGPFGRDPLAIRVQGGLVALRRADALKVEVMVCVSER